MVIFLVFLAFSPSFRQVREWPTLELHETIRVSHAVACLIVFILFYVQDWQEGVLKHMKNDNFLVSLAVWVFLSKFLGRLRSDLY